MKVVILAGGFGTRLQEETTARPKPMVEIGGQPILWHIMKHYYHFGVDDFVIACGYMGNFIKSWFLDQHNLSGDLSIDFNKGMVQRAEADSEDWIVNLVDTGLKTNTGGRLRRLQDRVGNETFMLTYGDGVSNIDIEALLQFHRSHGKIATVSAVRPPARFGGLVLEGDNVSRFTEKPTSGEGWINGGFLVFEPGIFDYLSGDECSLEGHALEKVAADGQLAAYQHPDFWQCMDTLRDRNYLQGLWESGKAPWKTWDQDTPKTRLRVVPKNRAAA